MDLDTSFSVAAPIDAVWAVLMDFDRVASAVPGAEILNRLSDDALQVGMKVKLGPVALQYRGLVNVVEINSTDHRAKFSGSAQETRGQGTVDGSATVSLSEVDGTTTGTVHAELSISGKAAAMGKGVINSVTDQMMSLFAGNLQAMALEGVPGTKKAESAAAAPPASATTTKPADSSLNGLSLVKGIVLDQLSNPAKLAGLVGAVGLLGFLIGRAGRRS